MHTKNNEAIKQVLKQFGDKYFIEDVVNKSKVIQDLDGYDAPLLEAFITNETIKNNFTIDITGNVVMQTNKLIDLFEADEYWQDSYTKYSKKIGLTAGGKFIDESTDVVLDFPYKDTVLKASMSKEDTDKDDLRPDEPFLNEVIAKEEIDVLLDKKILVNAKKYDENGVHDIDSFDENDNLIMKGNNLLALHTLKEKYAGKVKLIYIDPPYNTGNDGFNYNDRFNHSTWLTFIKNRLEVAYSLLGQDGFIFVQCDDNEQAYLKVLMDETFGRNNFINVITVKTKIGGVSGSSEGKSIRDATEFINVFAKNKEHVSINRVNTLTPLYQHIQQYVSEGKSWKYTSIITELSGRKFLKEVGEYKFYSYDKFESKSVATFAKENNMTEEEVYTQHADKIFRTTNAQSSVRQTVINETVNEDFEVVELEYYPIKGKNKNKLTKILYKNPNRNMFMFLSDVAPIIDGQAYYTESMTTLWEDIQYNNLSKEGEVDFTNGKKPEALIKRVIELSTDEEDIVLDFFMGSGTTQAVAHKMNRRYIGVEQMDYINKTTVPRIQKVIKGEQNGISKDVDWQGGGSFVYVELMEKNRGFLTSIQNAETTTELQDVFTFMLEEAEIDFRVDLEKVKETLFEKSLSEQKKTLIKIIDKNQLYYNYSEIDDQNVRDLISDNDYSFNKSFYSEGDE
ncbi:site-specific DNA-methyltransferase [Metalysinibacillus jejuensis]|uniref:site-specific DNA-methyltransferase n=1 Tax=Metalysinibacillus jejuensis TaxID=914327 RepID=UPI0019129B55|nr:site-specific DNA-methyltransferase [Metalysinibacillus jejuensis]